ncbi:MAG: cyclodeaminase/cyclohydrolase family protein [Clostridiales Family XIII bacterium]|jgi:formiminotetrahydrofolate cyclodeaminase|nr:cyclodeaminase/cyclohydrolase family protein [Clostridiales Family XIII bacterium]
MGGFAVPERDIAGFLDELSSKSPTPGGGGASALAGALAAALGSMVANLTIGKEKYRESEDEMLHALARLRVLRDELLRLADKDAEAFAPLAAAYGLPAGNEEERRARASVMEPALKAAALVPLEIMKHCAAVIELLEVLEAKGSVMAVSDTACGAALAKAALRSAWLNVRVNTRLMTDAETAERIDAGGSALLAEYAARADQVYEDVEQRLLRK